MSDTVVDSSVVAGLVAPEVQNCAVEGERANARSSMRMAWKKPAELAGYSKRTFMELLGKHGVAVMDYSPEDLQDDLAHA